MDTKTIQLYEKAGTIARESVVYAKSLVKKDMKLLELANKIEEHILKLGGKPAFPVNLSINEIAAHATPSYDDTGLTRGLLKVDLGVQVEGAIADTSFSVDLDGSSEHAKLIHAAQAGLNAATELVKRGARIGAIGHAVDAAVKAHDATVVHNLCGHSIELYEVHAGVSLPNYDDGSPEQLEEGVFAFEPFTTFGHGSVRDGKPSGIYQLREPRAIRDTLAREILGFILEEYKTLPFASRWIHARFGTRGLLALRSLEQAGVLYQYPHLVEISGQAVAQAEHTVIVSKDKTLIIT